MLLTIHGEHLVPKTATEAAAQLAATGFAYLETGGTAGLPEFYQTAFHSPL